MKQLIKCTLSSLIILIALGISTTATAQDSPEYKKAMMEIKNEFGVVPQMFEVFPKHALAGAWENFKQLNSSESEIPPKYRELLQLAVAAQIPCQYCIYFHTAAAKAFGATDEEIQEAVAQGAQTRYWSMIMQGNQVDLEEFKKEFDGVMKYMATKGNK